MKATDIIKHIMKIRGMTQGDLTKKLGVSSQSGISAKLNRDLRVSTLDEFIQVLDCELVIRDKSTGAEWIVSEK